MDRLWLGVDNGTPHCSKQRLLRRHGAMAAHSPIALLEELASIHAKATRILKVARTPN